eukprot:TRINITY_DN95095_c0_g1_i1.p1 TRINITY_DN95095_c0_g1~~TRINITY_DN95095_c0_g1_i1.p1  ORF type:complete len:210 (+),score=26.25 TRINITY_DN95095_c0_g1_i1:3-632(+)
MLKAFAPPVVVAVMLCVGMPLPSNQTLFSLAIIVVGTLVEVQGELHATWLGLFLMLGAMIAEALNLVLSEKLLQHEKHKLTVIEGTCMLAPPGAVSLLAIASITELPDLLRSGDARLLLQHPIEFLTAAILGFGVNLLSLQVVQATSSLTLKTLNTVRSVGLVIVGVVRYGEDCSLQQAAGYALALAGFCLYQSSRKVAGSPSTPKKSI